MQRIMIIGSPGSGKSTLAREIGQRLDLPVYHMDHIHWQPGWIDRDRSDKIRMARDVIARDAWVFEGSHSATNAERLDRADLLIWLDLPVPLRSWRILRRAVRDNGHTRPDMQQGCPERLTRLPGFLRFVWASNHRSRTRARLIFETATIPRRRFRCPSDVTTYLERLT